MVAIFVHKIDTLVQFLLRVVLLKGGAMKNFYIPFLLILGLLLISCGEDVSSVSTSTSTAKPVAQATHAPSKTWHVTQHFSSTVSFLGHDLYEPNQNELVTVARPWRVVWQAHYANKGDTFSLIDCQTGGDFPVPDCNTIVFSTASSGITAPITKVYNDITLDEEITCCGDPSPTWSFDIEELN